MMDDDDQDRDYDVGYGRPPKHSRFKPGQSGNPGGRPKKSKEMNTLFRKELDKTIEVVEDGCKKRITKREAIVTQVVNRAIKGDPKSLQLMYAHLQNNQDPEPFVSTEADDAELLRAFAQIRSTMEVDNGTD